MDDFFEVFAPSPVEGGAAGVPTSTQVRKSESRGLVDLLPVVCMSIEQLQPLCCFFIGGKTGKPSSLLHFCILPSTGLDGGCDTRHQGLERYEPHCNAFYVAHKDGKSLYAEPYVMEARVSVSLSQDWKSERQMYRTWARRFAVINAVDSPATNEDIDARLAGYDNKIGVASPTRRSPSSDSEDEQDSEGYSAARSLFPTAPGPLLTAGVEYWRLNQVVNDDFMEGTLGLWEILQSVQATSVYLEDNVCDDFEKLSVRVGIMEAEHMAMPASSGDNAPGEEFMEEAREFRTAVNEAVERVKERVATIENSMRRFEGENVNARMTTVECGLGKMGPWAKDLNAQARVSANRVAELEVQVQTMMRRIEQMEQAAAGQNLGASNLFNGSNNEVSELREENQSMNFTLTNRLNLMERQIKISGARFGGIDLDTAVGVQEWVAVNMKEGGFGVFVDFVSFFPNLYTNYIDVAEDLQRRNQEDKLKYVSEGDATCVTSFTNVLPAALGKDKDFSKPLPALSKPECWSSPQDRTGLKHVIEDQIANIRDKFLTQIHYMETAAGQTLARLCLDATISFVAQFSIFFTDLHQNLHQSGGYDKHSSWLLTCRIGRRIFDEMASVRVCAKGARSVRDPMATTARYLLGILRTHAKMEEFVRARFENHPVIASEYVKFFATNSATSKVEAINLRLVALERTKDNDKKLIDSLSSKIAGANAKSGK